MDADLVRPAGFEAAFDERGVAELAESVPMSHCALATGYYRNLFPVVRGACERLVHRSRSFGEAAGDDRLVAAVDRMRLELGGEAQMRAVGLSGDHQSRRVL